MGAGGLALRDWAGSMVALLGVRLHAVKWGKMFARRKKSAPLFYVVCERRRLSAELTARGRPG